MKFKTINPASSELIKEYETMKSEEVFEIARKSSETFKEWRETDFRERVGYLKKVASILRKRKGEFGKIITTEMGKPIKQAISEVEKCAFSAEVYAENGEKWLEEEVVKADGKKHIVTYEPLGVILSIMPWNFPFFQAFKSAIPALTAGNVSILRHSNIVPECAFAIEGVFQEAGLPDYVFKAIVTDHATIADMIKSDLINGVSFTGSVDAGKKIGELAGASIKKLVLELGGSDPFIVLKDAELNITCSSAAEARAINSGQACVAAKRFIVVKEIAKEFSEKFVNCMRNLKVGDPLNPETDVGPLVREEQLITLQNQLNDSVKMGAKVLLGGKRLRRKGYFFEPTTVTNVKSNMRIVKEEVFGPVAPIIVVESEGEAIREANNSEFGLGASIWSRDEEKALKLAKRIDAGIVFINSRVKADPRMPFGGIKKSGIGREASKYGLMEFVNVKGINIY